jgi:Holliday junction resolvase RusA-like endonuclease
VYGLNIAEGRQPDVLIELPGLPHGKGAGRAGILKPNPGKGRFTQRAMVFQDSESRSYEAMLRYAGEKAMAGRPLFDEPLSCCITAVFPCLASWTAQKRIQALQGLVPHAVRPDDDNLIKTRDGLKKIVWTDDSRICESLVRKLYGEKPFLRIEVWRWIPPRLI